MKFGLLRRAGDAGELLQEFSSGGTRGAVVFGGRVLSKLGARGRGKRAFESVVRRGEGANANELFAWGDAQYRLKNWEEAMHATDRALASVQDPPRRWLLRKGDILSKMGQRWEAADYFQHLVADHRDDAVIRRRAAKSLAASGLSADGANLLQREVLENPRSLDAWRDYVNFVRRSAPIWQRVDVLTQAVEVFPERADWWSFLGLARVELGQYEDAVPALRQAANQGSRNERAAGWLAALTSQQGAEDAERCLEHADKTSPALGYAKYGPGVHFAQIGRWPAALDAFLRWAETHDTDADLHHRIGEAAERSLQWDTAAEHFRAAVQGPESPATWWERLGIVYERKGEPENAVEAYSAALERTKGTATDLSARLGRVLAHQGRTDAAVSAYRRMYTLPKLLRPGMPHLSDMRDVKQSLRWYRIPELRAALSEIKAGRLDTAEKLLAAYCAANPSQDPKAFYLHGVVLADLGLRRQALDVFGQVVAFARPSGVSVGSYLNRPWKRLASRYVEYQETLPLDPQLVLYESYFGSKVDCNPLAIYRRLRDDPRAAGFTHIWVANPAASIPSDVSSHPDTIVVPRGSTVYLRYLATATYLVNNVTFPHWFVRRDGQSYLNTWHGTPLKTLGKDIGTGVMEHANVARNFLHTTTLLAPNAHTEHVLTRRYDIDGMLSAGIGRVGTPRSDEMINVTPEQAAAYRSELGIAVGKTVVFYAPTWRGSQSDHHADTEQLIDDLTVLGARADVHLIFRAHHFMEELLENTDLGDVTVVPSTMSTARALSVTDVLVTDYSSIFFDFLPLRRPIIYNVYDLEEYTAERGLYFNVEDMPGYLCRTRPELAAAVDQAIGNGLQDTATHDAAIELYAAHEDGHASERAVDLLLGVTVAEPVEWEDRIDILFHQSMLPNGITSSFLNLVQHLDPATYRLHFLFDPKSIENEPLRMERWHQMPDHVQMVARVGGHLLSLQERWAIPRFNAENAFYNQEHEDIYRRAFKREYYRVFGTSEFDAVVEFDGYAPFWAALLSADPAASKRRTMYFHNRIHAEMSTKYPELKGLLHIAPWFESLVSVSEATSDINREELAEEFSLPQERFTFAENMLDEGRMAALAVEELDQDIASFLDGAVGRWLTIGRMSPEKGHEKLFSAFERHVRAGHEHDRLVVLGSGPLFATLTAWISNHDMAANILLAGQRPNPFAVMRACEYFVLASDHEGQPMVLLEALSNGMKVAATDITGSRSVLEGGLGLLVANDVEGVASGLAKLPTYQPEREFDLANYQTSALHAALEQILPEGAR